MSYGVHYRTSEGESRFDTMASLDEAVALVERLRNEQQTADARLFREVPLEVRTYVKVVVRDESAPAASGGSSSDEPSSEQPPATASVPPPGAMPLSPPVHGTPSAVESDEQQRRAGLFSRT